MNQWRASLAEWPAARGLQWGASWREGRSWFGEAKEKAALGAAFYGPEIWLRGLENFSYPLLSEYQVYL
jgi:hypothetical protein